MSNLFSPKQVAQAIGVSESSLKRWVDRGLIRSRLSPGGHRRLELGAVVEFLQANSQPLADPAVLGLPAGVNLRSTDWLAAQKELYDALVTGDEAAARRLLLSLHLNQRRISELGDLLIAPVFGKIGADWTCGSVEAYEERRACLTIRRLLEELRQLISAPPPTAPLAVGCTPAGDPYDLAAHLVALTLQQRGWNAQLLGENVPLASATAAVRKLQPKLFWLSVSHLAAPQQFLTDYNAFYQEVGASVPIILGGRALNVEITRSLPCSLCCRSLGELETYLNGCEHDPLFQAQA